MRGFFSSDEPFSWTYPHVSQQKPIAWRDALLTSVCPSKRLQSLQHARRNEVAHVQLLIACPASLLTLELYCAGPQTFVHAIRQTDSSELPKFLLLFLPLLDSRVYFQPMV